MDENYLDDLLTGMSSNNKPNKNFDNAVDKDAGIDIDMSDLDDISLDELDELDDLDLGDLDIDDIDFDDIDITSLSAPKKAEAPKQEEDFNLDDLLMEAMEEEQPLPVEEEVAPADDIMHMADAIEQEDALDEVVDLDMADLFSALEEKDSPTDDAPVQEEDFVQEENSAKEDLLGGASSGDFDLDDLFSALGIEDDEPSEGSAYTAGEADLDELFKATAESAIEDGDLDDILDIDELDSKKKSSRKKKGSQGKKSLSEIIFGEPDEDDLEEERLYEAKKAQRAAKKEEKKAQKEVKNAEKKEKLEAKKKSDNVRLEAKKAKKAAKEAAYRAELEAEKDEKKVATPVVIVVFMLFIALAILVVLGTKTFNYSQVIKRAADYFDRQRYRLAYDEVSGVEIKEEDEELRDRIYTVMYVERLYESYENNMSLGRPDMALDALLRGLEKYDVHYQEAVELDIVEDIDNCRAKIVDALTTVFGISEAEAYDIMALDGQEYSEKLLEYSDGIKTGE